VDYLFYIVHLIGVCSFRLGLLSKRRTSCYS